MAASLEPHRCPKCHALVVDRRSLTCTTCRTALPAEWIMTKEQAAKMMELDAKARAEHLREMKVIDPRSDPNMPPIVRMLETPWGL